MPLPHFLETLFHPSRSAVADMPPEHAAVADMLASINEGASQHGLPTLVCRECDTKYVNRGTFFNGSACPACDATEARNGTTG